MNRMPFTPSDAADASHGVFPSNGYFHATASGFEFGNQALRRIIGCDIQTKGFATEFGSGRLNERFVLRAIE